MPILLNVIIFVLILSFLVIIHEIGHFVTAKLLKIKVEEFGLGYPPRAITLFKKWGSIFTLNWVPFGGFVRMEGEYLDEAEDYELDRKASSHGDGPFYAKSIPARLAVILAGATVNFLFGILAFSVVFSLVGIPSGAIIDRISPDSPAAQVGIPAQVAVEGITANGKYEATPSVNNVIALVQANRGQEITVHTIGPCADGKCESNQQTFVVTPRTAEHTPEKQGSLGIGFERDYLRFYPWYEMPLRGSIYGVNQALGLGAEIIRTLGTMIRDLVTRGQVPAEVAGPVGIVHEATQSGVLTQGPIYLTLFAGLLSINLAVMNVLPVPALDGGRAFFLILELFLGKKRIRKVEGYANYAGYALLLALIVAVTFRDITRIF